MRALAGYIMQSRSRAVMVAGATSAIPMLFWASAATVALVLLRKGPSQAGSVAVAALMPALAWLLVADDPFVLLVIAATLALAQVLRQRQSWIAVLLVSIVTGLLAALALESVFAQSMQEMANSIEAGLPEMFGELYSQLGEAEVAHLHAILVPLMAGLTGAAVQLISLGCLMLARYWQACLYNPGGFGQEFRAIRLPAWLAGGLVAFMLLAPQFAAWLAVLVPLCAAPLALAGLAAVHGLLARHRVGLFWTIGLYALLLVFVQLLYPVLVVLALTDSVFDFRGLKASARKAE